MTAQDTNVDTLKKTFIALKRTQARVASLEARRAEPIAIVGIACRLPGGANDPDALWSLLCRGEDTAGPIPADRWDESQFYSAAPDTPGRTHAAQANFLDIAVDAFDAPFFGVSAKEALSMDPQQRLLLELGWEALEDAGVDPTSLRGSATGVFVGISSDDYAQAHRHSGRLELIDGYSLTGTCMAPAAGRISYTFGFEGPSLAVDTACSSSLVAVHLACQSLREGESDVALAAGINLMLSPVFHIASSKLGTISPDGLCKTFDESADGYGRGEGGGMVVLKRLANAQADGDRILAVIRGSAVNQDGKSNGLTAPNGLAQERVIREALDRAGLMPADIDYIEVHGTGTSLGDPIEVEAIGRVMLDRPVDRPVVLGTVKSNIGHLEAAAGIAGLIRAVQCLRHEEIPAHLHLDRPSQHIPWGRYPFKVVTERTAWSRGDRPRRAGVSSFGFSGTNAHVILEEAPLLEDKAGAFPEMGEGEALILPLSARTEEGLVALATRWREWLSVPTAPIPAGVATAAAGRHHMAQRVAIVGRDAEELIAGLTAFVEGKPDRAVATGSGGTRPRIAGLFTGQGSQYAGMGRGLYAGEPVFRATIDACDAAVGDRLGRRLVDLLYGDDASDAELQQTGFAQPALFAVELALYRLLESWGVVPQVVCGHSIGEFAAAHVAGILSFDAAIEMVCARGRLMQALPDGGAMAAVFASEEKITQFLTSSTDISLAAVNTPDDVVVSGPAEAVRVLLAELEQRGIRAQPLRVSHAFHSTLMRPMVADFVNVAARPFGSASMPIVSTVTGRRAGPDEMACADYWTGQIGATVRFAAAAAALAEDGVSQFLEYGPAPVLAGLAQQSIDPEGRQFLGTLVRGADDDRRSTLQSLARLYASGVDIDWKAVYHRHRARVAVPTYPFQRTRYYRAPIVDAGRHAPIVSAGHAHPYLGQRIHSRLLPSGAALYQALFTAAAPSFLVEHQIFGVIISPAAAHLSMAFAAAGHGRGLEDVSFTAPLVIEAAAPRLVQLGMTGDPAPVYTVASQAVDAPGDVWTVHSEGCMTAMPGRPDRVDLDAFRRRCTVPMAPAEFYALIETLGYKTGENFQCIREIAKGDGEALCRIAAPQPIDGEAIHPGLIDSMLQTVLPACERSAGHLLDGESVLIPLHMARVALYGSLDQPLFCHSRVEVGGEVVKAEILACTAQGEAVLAIEGFLLKRTDRATLYQEMRDDDRERVQRIAWQPITITADAELQGSGWMVLSGGDAGNAWGGALAAHIVASGGECLVLEPGADFARAVQTWLARRAIARVTVVFVAEESGVDPVAETRATLAAVLPVVQALNRGAIPVEARLWLLSRQAQAVVPEDAGATRPMLAGAALWGFGRAIASEMPELWGGLIDVDPRANAAGIAALAALVAHPGGEDQLAIRRGGQVFAARLVPSTDRRQEALPKLAEGQKYRLDRGPLRTLDDLRFARLARAAPGKDEVEIEVLAAGLNFRDVLNALGQYPGEAGLLGFEAVGRIVALGNAAGGLALGDTVIALAAPGCIGSHVTVNCALVVRKPADMSAVTAVALPAALLTAYYALHHLGGMQRGDRVLIHAAAGGVGMAAVQLALAAGAEVFATVGSPEKRAVLEAMGVTHILSSRTLDFVEQIRRATDGRGVTMVLNSLSGSFIAASFDVLAPGGRFLEMGKIGIWDEAQVRARDPHALYRPFDLAAVGRVEVDAGRQRAMADRQHRLDHSRNPRCRFGMADIRLDRTQFQTLRARPVSEDRIERAELDRIAERRARTMCLDIVDPVGSDPGIRQRRPQHRLLRQPVGGGEAVAATIMIDRGPGEDAVDEVAIAHRVAQSLKDDEPAAFATAIAGGVIVERPAATVCRQRLDLAQGDAAVGGQHQADAPSQRDVAVPLAQCGDRRIERDQRRGTGGVERDAGAAQIVEIGQAPRGGAEHHPAARIGRDTRRIARMDMRLDVIIVRQADEYAGAAAREPTHVDRGVFERFPADFEQQALLRVERFGFGRRDPEEGGVEAADVVDQRGFADVDVARRIGVRAPPAIEIEPVHGYLCHGITAAFEQGPESFGIIGAAGKAAAHADDGDRPLQRARGLIRRQRPYVRRRFAQRFDIVIAARSIHGDTAPPLRQGSIR
nr:type I polyketide synthase [Sphingomonas aurantiaca]